MGGISARHDLGPNKLQRLSSDDRRHNWQSRLILTSEAHWLGGSVLDSR